MTVRESDTYRRGLTLGLTMAEIFILILFLLLLVLLALYAVNFEQEKELQSATEYITDQQNLLPENIVPLTEENQSLKKENQILKDALDAADTESGKLQNTIDNLSTQLAKAKGIDPPYWYKVTNSDGERHEKPYYLMDVAVYNEYLQVRMREAPLGYALDESKQKATTS